MTVLVQKCSACCILFQPLDDCIVNIGDSLLVSIGKQYTYFNENCKNKNVLPDIYFLMRSLVHLGSPLSTVATTLLENIGFRNDVLFQLERTRKDWICRLITAGNILKLKFFFC